MVSETKPRPSSKSRKLRLNAHPQQKRFMESERYITAAIAGTGGGKTVGGMGWLLKAMVQNPGMPWIVAEPTMAMIDRILLTPAPGRLTLVQVLALADPNLVYLKSKRTITTKFGTVFLISGDNPDAFQGAQVGGIWLDECGLMGRLVFLTALQRLGFYGGKLLLTSTPYNRGWFKTEVADKAGAGDKDIMVVNFPSLANPLYPAESVAQAKARMSKERFSMMYEGKFGRPEGMIFDCFDQDSMVVDDFDVPDRWVRLGGFDFGFNHPAAGLHMAVDDDGIYYITGEYYETNKTASYAGKTMAEDWGVGYPLYCSPERPDSIVDVRRSGHSALAANNNVLDGIDTVYGLFKTGRLKLFRSCRWLVDELESYVWEHDEDQGHFLDKPVKLHDDLCDALRYGVHSFEQRGRVSLAT